MGELALAKARRKEDALHNHLRRLLGWVRCDIGQSPEEYVATARSVLAPVDEPSEEAKQRLVQQYRKSERIPKYVRAAVTALTLYMEQHDKEAMGKGKV